MSLPESLKVSPQKPWFSWVLLGFCVLAVVVGLALPASKPPADSASAKASGETGDKIVKTIQKMSGGYLAHIKLQGPISMELDDSLFGQDKSNAVGVRDALNEAAEEDGVKGILLTINSPGGTVAMSQELNAAVTRARAKKPVVVYMGDTAASGGYYTACAADEIVANPGTLTASIGVIMSGLSFQELTNKLGIKANTVKSGKFKDLMSPYRNATPDETALLQGLINSS
jgi:protease-4